MKSRLIKMVVLGLFIFSLFGMQVTAEEKEETSEELPVSTIIYVGNEYLEALSNANDNEKARIEEEYSAFVYELKTNETIESLHNMGLDDEQINLIINYDGSQDISIVYRYSIVCSQSISSYVYTGGKTKADLNFSFSRSGVSIHNHRDVLAVAWTEGFYCTSTSNMSLAVTYKSTRTNSTVTYNASNTPGSTVFKNTVGTGNAGAVFEFEKKIGTRMLVHHASGSIHLEKTGYIPEFSFLVSYIESQVNLSYPSASIGFDVSSTGVSGGASISLSLVSGQAQLASSLQLYEI